MFEVSYLPILLAGAASVALAFVWYHPRVFGSLWMRLVNLTPEQVEKGKKRMPAMALIAFLGSMLSAYVMAFMLPLLVIPDLIGAIEFAIWTWLGFVAPTMLGEVLWEQQSFKLYLINALFLLASFTLMATILVL